MSRAWRPVVVAAVVAAAVFVLAQAQVFEPSAAGGGAAADGDVYRGQLVFERECAGCHGPSAEGGTGPALKGAGLSSAEVTARVREGAGIMPAGLVSGQEEADVVAYVVSIARG